MEKVREKNHEIVSCHNFFNALFHNKPYLFLMFGDLSTLLFANLHICDVNFHQLGPLGRVGLVVTESVCVCVCVSVCLFVPSHAIFFEASHWPSDHMTRSRPLIGQASFPTICTHMSMRLNKGTYSQKHLLQKLTLN